MDVDGKKSGKKRNGVMGKKRRKEMWLCRSNRPKLILDDQFSLCASNKQNYTDRDEFCEDARNDSSISFVHFGSCEDCSEENVCSMMKEKQERLSKKLENLQNRNRSNKKKNKDRIIKRKDRILKKIKNKMEVETNESNGQIRSDMCAFMIARCDQFKEFGTILRKPKKKVIKLFINFNATCRLLFHSIE